MPRNKRILQNEFPYHVTSRTVNKQNFPVDLENSWKIFSRQLHFCSFAFQIEIHAFVLMNNHYHLLVRTPNANLSDFMCYLNKEISKEMNRLTGRINQVFGSRYYSCIINDPRYYLTVYRYIYRNPINAGLCNKVQQYKYSSLNFVLGADVYKFPVFDSPIVESNNYTSNLNWLNQAYSQEEHKKIRNSLKKPIFEP